MSPTMDAYHFVGDTLRDGQPVPPDGEWLEYDGPMPLIMCERGLHASLHPFDGLRYAPGPILCRVEVGGEIVQGEDKVVATRRRIIRRVDATDLCRAFARRCALDVAHMWKCPPVVREYLETGREKLRAAARDAARYSARAAAGDAARYAAWYAAWAAAGDAAWAAARAAAWAAAGAAAWAAAWDAARDAAGDAARDAARDAAGDALRPTVEALQASALELVERMIAEPEPKQ